MPELPEVETLVRGLSSWLVGRTVHEVAVGRERVIRPTSSAALKRTLRGATFSAIRRRGKFILFHMHNRREKEFVLLGHLGMTGRMYSLPANSPLPKHAAIVLKLDKDTFVFEDTRYFGRFTLDTGSIDQLGPEPLGIDFTVESFGKALALSKQPIKVKLLDQTLVAGIGNIYACEALFRAGILPGLPARKLQSEQIRKLHAAIREVLEQAVSSAAAVQLNFEGNSRENEIFYFGTNDEADADSERFHVYDRAGKPCYRCGTHVKRIAQANRSTYYCPKCQARHNKPGNA